MYQMSRHIQSVKILHFSYYKMVQFIVDKHKKSGADEVRSDRARAVQYKEKGRAVKEQGQWKGKGSKGASAGKGQGQ